MKVGYMCEMGPDSQHVAEYDGYTEGNGYALSDGKSTNF
jgi:hypothetical protein